VYVTDAVALPSPAGRSTSLLAFMSLHDVTDLPEAVRELRGCSTGRSPLPRDRPPAQLRRKFESEDPASPFTIRGSYLEPFRYADEIERDGLRMRSRVSIARSAAYFDALQQAGLLVEVLREPLCGQRDTVPGEPPLAAPAALSSRSALRP